MALVGYSVMVSVPVLSTALVDMLGFTEVQVGRVWGADIGGLSIGAVLAAMLVARVNRRHLVLAAFTLLVFWKTPPWLVVILTALVGWALHAGVMP